MKKLSLIMALLFWFSLLTNTYADDLQDLADLLNSEAWATTTDTNNEADAADTANTETEAADTADTATDDSSSTQEWSTVVDDKIVLSLTWDVKTNAVSLTFKKLADYAEYKVYYSKVSDTELSEKTVSADASEEDLVVEIDWLEADTNYQFVAKAFDLDSNPIASTESESLEVTTAKEAVAAPAAVETQEDASHPAATDNIIYNPVIKSSDNKIDISYKLGTDVRKVQIAISEDAKTFTPVTTLPASTTSYSIPLEKAWKKYIKLVPIDAEGELWVCKIWKSIVKDHVIPVTHEEIGKPKTWPAMYLLFALAIAAYSAYAIRRARA